MTIVAAQAKTTTTTTTTRQFHPQQGDNDHTDDAYMQTFVALREEKRRLLDTAAAAAAAGTSADQQLSRRKHARMQQHQQMSDLSRRLHAVVQRMSAYDRYKRKSKKTIRNHTTTTAASTASESAQQSQSATIEQQQQQRANDEAKPDQQQMSLEWIVNECNRISQMEADVDECRERLVNFDGWKRLADEMQKDVHVYEQCSNMLRGQPVETNTDEEESNQATEPPREYDQRRNSWKELVKRIVEWREESRSRAERSRVKAEEEARLFQARLEEQRTQADERARLRKARFEEQEAEQARLHLAQRAQADEQLRLTLAQIDQRRVEMERARLAQVQEQQALEDKRRREREDRFEEQKFRIFRRIDKRKVNDAWHDEWRSRRPLIVQRRANQAANAG